MTMLQVIATTDEGTRAALSEARHLVGRLQPDRIVLLVPRLDQPGPLERGPDENATIVDGYRRLASDVGVNISVRLCACSGLREAARWLLPQGSTVVIGGRRRWWWPTEEERFADLLSRTGYQTFFADCTTMPG
jgi:hypothetical protein